MPLWLVTHVDLHRTAKVQAFLQASQGRPRLAAGPSTEARGHLAMLGFSALVAGSFSLGSHGGPLIAPAALNAARFMIGRGGDRACAAASWQRLPARLCRAPWRYLVLGGLSRSISC